jgi:hypothetical protein
MADESGSGGYDQPVAEEELHVLAPDETGTEPGPVRAAASVCWYGGQQYSEGSVLTMSGQVRTCRDGAWV